MKTVALFLGLLVCCGCAPKHFVRGETPAGAVIKVKLDQHHPVDSVFKCWDKLEKKSAQCGTCYVEPGSLTSGRLERRANKPADQNCWVDVVRAKPSS